MDDVWAALLICLFVVAGVLGGVYLTGQLNSSDSLWQTPPTPEERALAEAERVLCLKEEYPYWPATLYYLVAQGSVPEIQVAAHPEWSSLVHTHIVAGQIALGMTPDMVRASWGKPDDINRSVGPWGVHEQWVYGYKYLYFEDGILTSWQD
jgi:hypothetical protein